MEQFEKDDIFLLHFKTLIEAVGGTEICRHVLILENPELFDYGAYNEALDDFRAVTYYNKTRKHGQSTLYWSGRACRPDNKRDL